MRDLIDKLIWDDLSEELHICSKCYTRMKLDKDSFDFWYCPNPKCKEVYIG